MEHRKNGGIDRTWSQGEYNRMVALCWREKQEDFGACIVLAFHTGLRIHEVMRLDTATARAGVKSGQLTVKGKGGKVRQVPLDEVAKQVLDGYLKKTPPGHKLFVPVGQQTHEAIYALQAFIRERRDGVEEAGREDKLHFHGLRHTKAAGWYEELLKQGHSDETAHRMVSKRLGRERPDVTDLYLASLPKTNKKKPDKGEKSQVANDSKGVLWENFPQLVLYDVPKDGDDDV